MRRVDIVGFPDLQLLDVAGPLQVLASANRLAQEAGRAAPYAARLVAPGGPGVAPGGPGVAPGGPDVAPGGPGVAPGGPGGGAVVASAGLGLLADPLPPPGAPLDTLIVAGGEGVLAAARDPVLVAWVRARAGHARRVASVCTGAFLLAAAGLLDGRRAATHWRHCAELARAYPAVRVEADPIFVRDGEVWSSAGITAGIDLTLALVEADLGRALALATARQLVVFLKRPGGQAQFSTALALQGAEDRFGALHRWIGDNLARDLSLPTLARQAGMSERGFSRHYATATGLTPSRAVERLRVEAARHLLADTAQPVKRVAARCGFGSEETLRRSFARLLGTTPQEYRARFGG